QRQCHRRCFRKVAKLFGPHHFSHRPVFLLVPINVTGNSRDFLTRYALSPESPRLNAELRAIRHKGKSQMPDTLPPSTDQLLRMTADLAAAYVSNHHLAASQLPETIKAIHGSLASLTAGGAEAAAEPAIPAVPVRRSITPDYLVCLEDGKKQKTL